MSETTRKRVVYLVFVGAVIYGAVTFFGRGVQRYEQSSSASQYEVEMPLVSLPQFAVDDDTSFGWGRDPFARSRRSRATVESNPDLPVLTAISQGNTGQFAVIAGKVVQAGERVGEWTVVRIEDRAVVLSGGEEQSL